MIHPFFDKTDSSRENNYLFLTDFPLILAISAQKFQSISVVTGD